IVLGRGHEPALRLDRGEPGRGRVPGSYRLPSIRGFEVGVAVRRAFEDPRGGRDLGHGRLQDRLPARAGPGGERRTQVAVVGIFGRARLALPVSELAGRARRSRPKIPTTAT